MIRDDDQPERPPPVTRPARAAPPAIRRYSSELLAQLAQRTRFADPAIAARWREIAGLELAGISRPGRLSGNGAGRTLEVVATDGGAAQLLQMRSADLIARLNEFLGPRAVSRISILQSGGQMNAGGKVPGQTTGAAAPAKNAKPQGLAGFRREPS